MIYFDNAATSGFKPPIVIQSVVNSLENLSANPGRSGHKLAVACTLKICQSRETVAKLVGLSSSDNVIFTLNCTHALNLAIIGSVVRGGHVITSMNEHNSILRPLNELFLKGIIDLTILPPNDDGVITANMIENSMKDNTYMVALSHISNVTGAVNDIKAIGEVTRKSGVTLLCDAAQSIGYTLVDMSSMNIDMLAFPAHKGLHAPQGCGCLCFTNNCKPKPIFFGGTGTNSREITQPSDSPEGLESGTLNSPSIIALDPAIRWVATNHREMQKTQDNLQKTIYNGLKSMPKVSVKSVAITPSGIVSFIFESMNSSQICDKLDKNFDIATRGGLHCAPLIHTHLGTLDIGMVRASVSGMNTLNEAYIFLNAIDSFK